MSSDKYYIDTKFFYSFYIMLLYKIQIYRFMKKKSKKKHYNTGPKTVHVKSYKRSKPN